jgi:serine/arginine repetitive matrix protein 2
MEKRPSQDASIWLQRGDRGQVFHAKRAPSASSKFGPERSTSNANPQGRRGPNGPPIHEARTHAVRERKPPFAARTRAPHSASGRRTRPRTGTRPRTRRPARRRTGTRRPARRRTGTRRPARRRARTSRRASRWARSRRRTGARRRAGTRARTGARARPRTHARARPRRGPGWARRGRRRRRRHRHGYGERYRERIDIRHRVRQGVRDDHARRRRDEDGRAVDLPHELEDVGMAQGLLAGHLDAAGLQ